MFSLTSVTVNLSFENYQCILLISEVLKCLETDISKLDVTLCVGFRFPQQKPSVLHRISYLQPTKSSLHQLHPACGIELSDSLQKTCRNQMCCYQTTMNDSSRA